MTEATAPPAAPRLVTAPVLDKVRALAAQVGGLKALAHDAQVREVLTRTELTLALHESLAARADLLASLRAQALAAYRARRPSTTRRRRATTRARRFERAWAKTSPATAAPSP